MLSQSNQPMRALARQFEPAPQVLKNVRFAGGKPLEKKQVKEAIADAEAKLNGTGRIVVRASGTEPLIRIMAEGDDERMVKDVVKAIATAVEEAGACLFPFSRKGEVVPRMQKAGPIAGPGLGARSWAPLSRG